MSVGFDNTYEAEPSIASAPAAVTVRLLDEVSVFLIVILYPVVAAEGNVIANAPPAVAAKMAVSDTIVYAAVLDATTSEETLETHDMTPPVVEDNT